MKPKELRTLPLVVAALLLVGVATTRLFIEASGGESVIRRSVYLIRTYVQTPDFIIPWKNPEAQSFVGTGFYIGNGRIMTNAHVISHARFVTVQTVDGQTVPAKVAFAAHDADLAILTVSDESFFDHTTPLRFGNLPKLRSPVYTVGFPLGVEKVSVTAGVVSRIDYQTYVHTGYHRHLLVQVDSAINPGNSGGPIIQQDRVVGVAFQVNLSAQSTGYMIPTPMIRRFLGDIAKGQYSGHPDDGLTVQENALANPATAEYFGLRVGTPGVLVTHIARWSPFRDKLAKGDLLFSIDGHAIAADGRVFYEGERVDFKVYYDFKQVGELVSFEVMREGKTVDVLVKAAVGSGHYSSARIFPDRSDYIVYGGLVFEALSRNYLENWGDDWYEKAPISLRYLERFLEYEPGFQKGGPPAVLVARLPHAVNAYVDIPLGSVVARVNGKAVATLSDMQQQLATADSQFVVIEFWDTSNVVVLERAAVQAANQAIAKTYRVVSTPSVADHPMPAGGTH